MSDAGPVNPARRVRCSLGWIPNAEYAGFWVADAAGIYRDRGIAVEFLPGGPGRPGAIESLLEGTTDLAITSDLPSLLRGRASGRELGVLGAVMPRSPLGLAVLESSSISRVADLRGRVLGAGTTHDRPLLDALFAANELEADYELRTVDSGFAALASGDVDALSCSTINQVPAARDAGLPVVAWTFSELGLPMPGDFIACTAEWAATDAETARRFLAASAAGWRGQLEDPKAGARLTWERFGSSWDLDLDQCVRECELQAAVMRDAPHPLEIEENELVSSARLLCRALAIAPEHATDPPLLLALDPTSERLVAGTESA